MPLNISDLIIDSKLEIEIFSDYTIETIFISNPATGRRRTREQEQWQRTRKLGEGTFGVVWLDKCTRGPNSGKLRAVKELRKGTANVTPNYYKELEAIAKFSQERYRDSFVRSFGWYENDNAVFITMEYLQLGDLEGHLRTPLRDNEARLITQQLLEGLKFMHDNNFAHRDLKPSNILVLHKGPNWWIKIADFGITKRLDDTALRTVTGTEAYLAPEVRGIYAADCTEEDETSFSLAVDIWAVGAITFRIVTGQVPFPPGRKLFDYVVREQPFPREELMNPECAVFVLKTMARSPRQRPTIQQSLSYPWTQIQEIIPNDATQGAVSRTMETITPLASAQWSTVETIVPCAPAQRNNFDEEFATLRLDTPGKERQHKFQQVQKLEGHTNHVYSVAFSPDGRRLASSSLDRTVRIWEEKQGSFQQVQKLEGQNNHVYSVAFSPDGRRLVSGCSDRTVRIWEEKQGSFQQVQKLVGGNVSVSSVAFSPNGRRLVSSSRDGTVRIWEEKQGSFQQVQKLESHESPVYSVAFSPDGRRLASSGFDKTVRIWEEKQGSFQQVQKLEDYSEYVFSVAFSPDGRRLASSGRDSYVGIWEYKQGSFQQVQKLVRHSSYDYSLVFSPNGRQLASGSADGTLRIWEMEE